MKKVARRKVSFKLLGLGLMVLFAAGCSQLRFPAVFKIDVTQGNILETEKVQQLKPGMTQRQVLYLLGSPVLRNALEPNVWRYIYSFSEAGGPAQKYAFVLRFDGKVLRDIEGDIDQIKAWHDLASARRK